MRILQEYIALLKYYLRTVTPEGRCDGFTCIDDDSEIVILAKNIISFMTLVYQVNVTNSQ